MDKKTKMWVFIGGGILLLIIIIAIFYFMTKKPLVGVNPAKIVSPTNPAQSQNWLVSAINGATTLGGDFINTGGLSGSGSGSGSGGSDTALPVWTCADNSTPDLSTGQCADQSNPTCTANC